MVLTKKGIIRTGVVILVIVAIIGILSMISNAKKSADTGQCCEGKCSSICTCNCGISSKMTSQSSSIIIE